MASKRYTIIIADRSSGVVRRATLSLRPIFISVGIVAALPVLIGIGAAWKAKSDVADLRASHQALEAENANFRSATTELATQISSLEAAIQDIGARSALDPNLAKTMDKLPAVVKSRAMGGSTETDRTAQRTLSALGTPDDTFGLQTRYGHLLNYSVKQGAKVKRGDIIGHVGNTGRSTGYHLHYEVLANGKLLNPLQLLSQKPRAQ